MAAVRASTECVACSCYLPQLSRDCSASNLPSRQWFVGALLLGGVDDIHDCRVVSVTNLRQNRDASLTGGLQARATNQEPVNISLLGKLAAVLLVDAASV